MKPRIIHKLAATRDAVEKAFGPKSGESFIRNPTVGEYAVVLYFPDTKVILSGETARSSRKFGDRPGPFLIIARDMTVEARARAADVGCDVLTRSEFGRTDESYRRIRRHHSD